MKILNYWRIKMDRRSFLNLAGKGGITASLLGAILNLVNDNPNLTIMPKKSGANGLFVMAYGNLRG
jgi:hypothetical protein